MLHGAVEETSCSASTVPAKVVDAMTEDKWLRDDLVTKDSQTSSEPLSQESFANEKQYQLQIMKAFKSDLGKIEHNQEFFHDEELNLKGIYEAQFANTRLWITEANISEKSRPDIALMCTQVS